MEPAPQGRMRLGGLSPRSWSPRSLRPGRWLGQSSPHRGWLGLWKALDQDWQGASSPRPPSPFGTSGQEGFLLGCALREGQLTYVSGRQGRRPSPSPSPRVERKHSSPSRLFIGREGGTQWVREGCARPAVSCLLGGAKDPQGPAQGRNPQALLASCPAAPPSGTDRRCGLWD